MFTVQGRYQARGWTEWTEGFQFGSALLQFDATGESEFLELGRSRTLERMASHLTHVGVHDHGFNNVSTYGNLWRLAREGRIDATAWEVAFLRARAESQRRGAGAALDATRGRRVHPFVQWTAFAFRRHDPVAASPGARTHARPAPDGGTGRRVSLLDRLVKHARATARYNVYFGRGRDRYDVPGRTAHESLFNSTNGTYRGPSSQQGYSPSRTWTRGLAWAMLGFAEQIEFLETVPDAALEPAGGRADIDAMMMDAARATCDHYIEIAAADGVPYWDAGARGSPRSATGVDGRRSVQRSRTGRQFGCRDRRARAPASRQDPAATR